MGKQFSGINIQWPWSELIPSGKKTIETRSCEIPRHYIDQYLAVVETPGSSGRAPSSVARIIGLVKFGESYRYTSLSSWKADYRHHLVEATHPLFSYSQRKEVWAWPVKKVRLFEKPMDAPARKGIVFTKDCLKL
ncbi:MAG: hypothetical protein IPL83_07305 [Bdellovibrionales bacterium]|nr:hypothetical protein [Bdellovibrionales bacterium]